MFKKIFTIIFCAQLSFVVVALSADAEEPQKAKVPVTVNADKLDYDRANDRYVAEGNVKISQDSMRLEADRIILNNKTGDAEAEGSVYLQEQGNVIRADKLQININTKAGLIFNGDLFISKENLHFKGDIIERRSETEFHVEKGTFTTCDKGEWYLKADEIDVDMDRYATGSGVSFNMIGLPVFYTPYLLFPVRRQSGILIPELALSSSEGFVMKNILFWAINDYQDMTFYSDYRAEHGIGSGIEYRYVNSRHSAGNFYFNYFNTFNRYYEERYGTRALTDSLPPDARWFFSYNHQEEIAEDLSVRADINLVSDYAYFRDLERTLEPRSRPYLDSNLFYVERWETASLYLLGQYSTDLTQKNNDITLQKLPELRYSIFEEKIAGPVHVNFEGSATNFSRQDGANVMRADFDPRLSAVFGSEGVTITPRAGARATYYDRSGGNAEFPEPTDRRYYYAGADLNARLSRVYGEDKSEGLGRVRHSIEPTVSYNYVPTVEQTDIPLLDQFDTVSKQNFVSFSIINRITAHYKEAAGYRTFDAVIFRLSESYDLDKARSQEQSVAGRAKTALQAELFVKTPRLLTISATESYDTYTDVFTSSSESIQVRTDTVRFNLSRQYLHEPATRFLIAGAGAKLGNWDVDGQVWRDVKLNETMQQEYKTNYMSQCWALGLSFIKKPGETQYLLVLELKGLGALKF